MILDTPYKNLNACNKSYLFIIIIMSFYINNKNEFLLSYSDGRATLEEARKYWENRDMKKQLKLLKK